MPRKVVVKLPPVSPKASKSTKTCHGGKSNAKTSSPNKKHAGKPVKSLDPILDFRCRFLEDLPGEIRNQIYELAVGYVYVADTPFNFWTANTNDSSTRQLHDVTTAEWKGPSDLSAKLSGHENERHLWSHDIPRGLREELDILRDTKRRYRSNPAKIVKYRVKSRYSGILGHEARHASINLLFVCRQVYNEVISVVFSHATFAFGSPKSVRNKLLSAPYNEIPNIKLPMSKIPIRESNIQFISSLSLECQAYGSPYETKDIAWQQRYYNSWTLTNAMIVAELPALKDLSLFISIPTEPPIRLVLTDRWVPPFMQFAKCKTLENVRVCLRASYVHFDWELIEVFAEVLRRKILGWDDGGALEAITHAKSMNLVSSGKKSLTPNLQFMEKSNGVRTK